MKNLIVLLAILLPAYASAAKLDLKQELSGLDIEVTMVPPDDPDVLKIANKTAKVVTCVGSFTGADADQKKTITIKPGKSGTVKVPGNYADMRRSAELKCAEKPAKKAK
jgi:hypothetical protein